MQLVSLTIFWHLSLTITFNNVRNHYGLPCVVAVNRFAHDTEAEISLLKKKVAHHGVKMVVCDHWAKGGKGAQELAHTVVDMIDTTPPDFKFVYEDDDSLWEKITKVATRIYGASQVVANTKIRARSNTTRTRAMDIIPSASPKPSTPSRQIHYCAEHPLIMFFPSNRCVLQRELNSWLSFAVRS